MSGWVGNFKFSDDSKSRIITTCVPIKLLFSARHVLKRLGLDAKNNILYAAY